MRYALSIRQPWAALVAAGVKPVEVRTWPTARRGPVLIHAGRLPDPRPDAWAHVATDALAAAARLAGGVVGEADLADCVLYPTADAFAADVGRHLVPPAWFPGRPVYGFVFRSARAVAYHRCPGNTFFFPVGGAGG